ncbi:serine/threonine-protein kinase [Bryobacter aggregatus]|uniref:serine/threonine-protein kinase n=1 Tax=Bryobacter aggregatus TaxID=360054 RepID=UPI0004E281F6|nr:serine/threonine-protein kinase [Bryobacter aggregatus]
MNVERWRKVEAIFHGARALPLTERPQYLQAESGSDEELAHEVQLLLEADLAQDGLDNPFGVAAFFETEHEPVDGQRIGAYRLIRKIGSGGMGAVFLAERADEVFHKQVALKLMSGGGASLARRFQKERQILAALEHPNITRLLDGGVTAQGSPYLVMEFIDGKVLSDYAKDIPLDAKLRLFASVCDAVHYAHQRLIIHRDLKPGNVMVNAEGIVKLLDFGIAKLLLDTDSMDTVTQVVPMTPRYASPEQLCGEPVSTLSDIYSLGVMLQELIGSNAPRDLQKIASHAKETQAENRYPAAAEIAVDLRRYLAGEPVLAHEDSLRYRVGKFVMRHRRAVLAASLALLAVLVAAGVSIWQAQVAVRERAKAEAVSSFVIDLLAKANPERGADLKVADVLDDASEQLRSRWTGSSETEAALKQVLASSYRGLGLQEKAIREATDAVRISRGLYGERAVETGLARKELGLAHAMAFHQKEAETEMRAAIEILRHAPRVQDDLDELSLVLAGSLSEWGRPQEAVVLGEESLARIRAAKPANHLDVGSAYCVVGRTYSLLKQPEKRRDALERGAAILRQQARPPLSLASCIHMLAGHYSEAGDYARAAAIETEAIDFFRKRAGSQHADLAAFVIARASQRRGLHQWDLAYQDADEALQLALRSWPRASEGVAYMLYHYGRIECDSGRTEAGLAKLREALAYRSQPNATSPAQLAATQHSVARCLATVGNFDEAGPLARASNQVREKLFPSESRLVRESRELLADIEKRTAPKP